MLLKCILLWLLHVCYEIKTSILIEMRYYIIQLEQHLHTQKHKGHKGECFNNRNYTTRMNEKYFFSQVYSHLMNIVSGAKSPTSLNMHATHNLNYFTLRMLDYLNLDFYFFNN